MNYRILLNGFFIALLYAFAITPSFAAEKEVSFETEDGWTIYGMLGLPEGATGKVPAVILLHSFEHDQDAYGQYLYPGLAQIIGGRQVATLRFDFRGRGKSAGEKLLHLFSSEEVSRLYLDVRAAMDFLESQPQVDASRIGVVAEGNSAEAALRAWAGDTRIAAMIFVSGRVSETARKLVGASPAIPLFLVVSKEDRESFRDMADLYKLTENENSRISVYQDMGMGTTMFSVWRAARPKAPPIEDGLAEWMIERLKSTGEKREVTFNTEDGWTLYGTLRTPAGMSEKSPVPGVIMVHTAFTDRHIFDHFAEAVVKRGMAVLNFDTRGRGKSTGKGELLDLPPQERNNTSLDSKAAVNFLASLPGIGSIGLVGTDRGANYALGAAIGDSRVGALILMTTLINPKEREELIMLDIPVFYLASTDIEAITKDSMAEAYAATKNRGSRLLVYRGGALGYEIFDLDEHLEPTLAQWMKEQLFK